MAKLSNTKCKLRSFISSFVFPAIFLLGCSPQKEINKSESPLNIMTFNIRYGTANDGENNWVFRKEMVFDVIENFNPDFLGLQEALGFQINEILEKFPSYKIIGVAREDGKLNGEFSAILYKSENFKVDTSETFWLSDFPQTPGSKTWGNNYSRICTWGKFLETNSGKYFFILNSHFDHESVSSRIKSAEAIIKKVESFGTSLPIIFMGDLNTGETEETIKIIKQNNFVDSYYAVNNKSEADGTFNSFKGEVNGEKIDYIFINNIFSAAKAEIIRTNKNGKFPSDHFPVSAVLNFKK